MTAVDNTFWLPASGMTNLQSDSPAGSDEWQPHSITIQINLESSMYPEIHNPCLFCGAFVPAIDGLGPEEQISIYVRRVASVPSFHRVIVPSFSCRNLNQADRLAALVALLRLPIPEAVVLVPVAHMSDTKRVIRRVLRVVRLKITRVQRTDGLGE